ncbi:MAG: hypothetical protein HZA52_18890 [Planctomycetes bacterium]|nr:hypothetical protein [Planctomycetota bacterium]
MNSMLVGRAAADAATEFGYDPGGTPATFQDSSGRVLDVTKSLADEQVKEGDELWLVSSGGGV